MMKEIASLIVLLALCIPALAADMPDMVGNWTGTFKDVSWLKNTDFRASGKPDYMDDAYTISIEEQNGTRFAGRITLNRNPLTSEVLLGVIASNEITLVDEDVMFSRAGSGGQEPCSYRKWGCKEIYILRRH